MKKSNPIHYLKNTLKITLSLALGVFIFWLAYRQMDIASIAGILKNDVNYAWIVVAIFLGLLSHVFRAFRWKMLIEALDRHRRISTLNIFYAVMVGYLVNLLFPRAGEVARCGVAGKYECVSFTKVVGTMIAERAFDMLILLFICVVTVLLQINFFVDYFLGQNLALGHIQQILMYVGIVLAVFIFLAFVFWKRLKHSKIVKRIADLLLNIWQGMKTFLYVRSQFWFLFHGFMVWILYVAMLYACVFAFDFTSGLSVGAVFTVFVMGSLGVLIPVQGGIGTFHAMTIAALAFYGIGQNAAGGFALLAHGAQMALMIAGGLLSLLGLQFRKPKSNITE
ncbi:MAG: flippase-like domain-containing protein [Prevotellaceae bacterium]|jgi:uncharacterized protein (TIRG00374 family)|nr:flippase-like domain-containing protein [Prevotellaceae bacterium]